MTGPADDPLRMLLAAHYDPVLDEAVPTRLLQAASAPPRRMDWRWPAAVAASLAAGLLVGRGGQAWQGGGEVANRGGALYASGALADSLQTGRAANAQGPQATRLTVSFRTAAGDYCRTFETASGLAGLACRDAAGWRMRMAVQGEPAAAAGGYRTAASSLPASVLSMVDSLSAGPPLDARGEAAAIAAGWRAQGGKPSLAPR